MRSISVRVLLLCTTVIALELLLCATVNAQTPTTAIDYLRRASERFQADDLDSAFADASTAIELNPKSVAAYRLRYLIRNKKEPETSHYSDCDMVIQLDPDSPLTAPF